MRIRPFQALIPPTELAPRVASVPYDVVDRDEAAALAAGNPDSMLRVLRAEIEFPAETSPYADEIYRRAAENLARLQAEGKLVRDGQPALYLYQQEMGGHRQRGLVALCHVDDYDADLIKKHEKTRPEKENDRTRLTSELSANPGPVFLTYRGREEIDALVDEAASTEPVFDFSSEDGIRHTGWRITDAAPFLEAFGPVPAFYVADGHHRAASAARVGRMRREGNPEHTGEEDYNWFLTVLFPATELKVLPYNRVVADLNGLDEESFMDRVEAIALPESGVDAESDGVGDIRMYLGGRWYRIHLTANPGADPASRLDVSLLQDRILGPILGIDDPRTNDRIEFVGGIRGTEHLANVVKRGDAAVAFSLYPVTVDQLMDIADAGQIMPPKSTWFEPKLRSGLFIHMFEPGE